MTWTWTSGQVQFIPHCVPDYMFVFTRAVEGEITNHLVDLVQFKHSGDSLWVL